MNSRNDKLIVVDPAMHTAETECYDHIRSLIKCEMTYVLPALRPSTKYPEIDVNTLAVIVLGSGASVHDGYPWQRGLHRWLRSVCLADIPVLGICYGHQAIAHIFGGSVELLWAGHKEKGVRLMELACRKLPIKLRNGPVIVSHREGVTKMPEDFDIVASSEACNVDGIKHRNKPVWGFQPHIEAVQGFLDNNRIDTPKQDDQFVFGHAILKAFLHYAHAHKQVE
ncbi:MAG: hypothetical protein VYA30_14845 [Myxococcota bacterium]|nr:hypothetical protein [Myxococcota bacterium]